MSSYRSFKAKLLLLGPRSYQQTQAAGRDDSPARKNARERYGLWSEIRVIYKGWLATKSEARRGNFYEPWPRPASWHIVMVMRSTLTASRLYFMS